MSDNDNPTSVPNSEGDLEAKLQTAIYRLCVIEDSPNLNAAQKALLRTWIVELKGN